MGNETDCGPGANRVAIVTGGSRCIGCQVARKLASQGYAVVINYAASQRDADAAVDRILDRNGAALAVRADVADKLDVQRLFDETNQAFGGIDVVVHAAARRIPGLSGGLGAVAEMQRTNLRGTFMINQRAARELREGGAIINLCSSLVAVSLPARPAYQASKDATQSITRTFAGELFERNITVNAVALGLDPPDATANLVAFLASEDGHSVTGQVLHPSEWIS